MGAPKPGRAAETPARGVVGEHEEHRAKPLSSAHEDMSRHGDDLATPRRFSVIEQRFEPGIDLLLETGKSLDLP